MHQTCASDSLNLPGPKYTKKVCLERYLTEGEVAEMGEPPAVSDNNGGDGIRHSRGALVSVVPVEGRCLDCRHPSTLARCCGDHAPGKRTVYDWVTAFKNGRQSADDRPRSGRLPTAVTAVNIKRVKDAILENRRLSFT